ncbi:DNA polymerase I [Halobacteroides halobius DSM 5150]|uniref:DNA polymerase I n=1 Tax=Halobacteroides halobius (strain ATCC 35273 / DSM 5150 / MD-1) TaxID=748449 RepID=L0K7A8_HALHC|nr:DNA polymerase I [Halobacteroides halobius]AGB40420.1 DNA polymerase I [Halobacteroides halobius DSM 5150]
MSKQRLYLLDGNSLVYRAFYALPDTLTTSDGTVTNAVFGFTKMLLSLIDNQAPDLIGIAFDAQGATFRHEEYEEYKANRKETPDKLKHQFDLVKEVVDALEIPRFEVESLEADDLIGTLAIEAEKEDYKVTIVTGDRDALQLISDNIEIMYTKRGISNIIRYDVDKFREDYELDPEQLVDKKALMGDKSDNIPGVDGIGDKTSTKLLKEFGGLEEVLDNIDQVGGKKRKQMLREQGARAKLSKRLATIKVDCPLEINFDKLVLADLEDIDQAYDLFNRLEFTSLISYLGGHKGLEKVDYQEVNELEELQSLKLPSTIAIKLNLNGPRLKQTLEGIIIATLEQVYYINLAEKELITYLEDTLVDKKLLMYQAKGQLRYLLQQGIEEFNLSFDPLLAAYLLQPSEDAIDLAGIIEKYLQQAEPEVTGIKLLAVRTNILFKLQIKLEEELKENDLLELFQDMELPLVRILAQLELNGIKVSQEQLENLFTELSTKISKLKKEICNLAGEEFNINSPQQLGTILFDKLDLPVIKKTSTGNYSTSAKVLEKLEGNHEIIPLISEYRSLTKLKSTYVDPLESYINEKTGRIHTNFKQQVTATGRLSSREPNLQNIPIRTEEGRKIRQVFVAQEGYKLVAADYSQVELRVLAHISQDERLKKAYQQGLDIHTQTAKELFGISTKQTRRKAKAVNFGIAYGISDWGLADRLKINKREAKEYIDLYFSRYPKVKEYIDDKIRQAKKQGYVTTIFDRKRYLPEINSRNYHKRQFAERTAINTPIQGSAADIMKLAMLDVAKALEKEELASDILLQVHDELVLEVPKDEVKKVAKLVKKRMEDTVNLDVPLEVDVKVGDNWNEMEEY